MSSCHTPENPKAAATAFFLITFFAGRRQISDVVDIICAEKPQKKAVFFAGAGTVYRYEMIHGNLTGRFDFAAVGAEIVIATAQNTAVLIEEGPPVASTSGIFEIGAGKFKSLFLTVLRLPANDPFIEDHLFFPEKAPAAQTVTRVAPRFESVSRPEARPSACIRDL